MWRDCQKWIVTIVERRWVIMLIQWEIIWLHVRNDQRLSCNHQSSKSVFLLFNSQNTEKKQRRNKKLKQHLKQHLVPDYEDAERVLQKMAGDKWTVVDEHLQEFRASQGFFNKTVHPDQSPTTFWKRAANVTKYKLLSSIALHCNCLHFL